MGPRITAPIELLILPYSSVDGESLLHRLIQELGSGRWKRFSCAVAFGRQTGNYPDLLAALSEFVESGGEAGITFGADLFSGRTKGTDYEAVGRLLTRLQASSTFSLHLYHESGRTFHPKVYLFDNEANAQALVIVGSSNWSEGGLVNNVEANVVAHLDLNNPEHREFHAMLGSIFHEYWREA